MIYIIDHQDSFTWNVVHQFSEFDEVYCSNYFDINEQIMKKAFSGISLFFILVIITSVIILSTIGIKTNKFNNLISNKINQTNNNIKLDLKKIIFKIDLKKFSLFLETANPKLEYRSVSIPVREIKVYVDFLSLLQ